MEENKELTLVEKVEAEANKPSTTGGFSSGSSGVSAGTSASVQKAKDQYEKLQEAVAKAKREIEMGSLDGVFITNEKTDIKAIFFLSNI